MKKNHSHNLGCQCGLDIHRFISNSARVLTHGEADEAVLAPRGAPTVANLPVWSGCSGVVADELHAVVELVVCTRAFCGKDTAVVIVPRLRVDADRQGSMC